MKEMDATYAKAPKAKSKVKKNEGLDL